jgi:hypothetical protein
MSWLRSALILDGRLPRLAQSRHAASGTHPASGELHRLGWREADLASRRTRDPGKVAIAVRLRQETTLSVKAIAARLHPGTPASASVCLLAAMRTTTPGSPTQTHLAI